MHPSLVVTVKYPCNTINKKVEVTFGDKGDGRWRGVGFWAEVDMAIVFSVDKCSECGQEHNFDEG